MQQLRNFALGAALAAVLLAPAAWADGSLLAKGQLPDRAALAAASAFPGDAMATIRAAFPHLAACALRMIGAAQTSSAHVGSRNGS